MAKLKLKPPSSLKARLKEVGKAHHLGSLDDVVAHFVIRGLRQYDETITADNCLSRLEGIVDREGYSSIEELVEHLLLRGLSAYETAEDDPEKLARRLRGLGYID